VAEAERNSPVRHLPNRAGGLEIGFIGEIGKIADLGRCSDGAAGWGA
jgi:hypothetical protein